MLPCWLSVAHQIQTLCWIAVRVQMLDDSGVTNWILYAVRY